jgi:hypothetical protein
MKPPTLTMARFIGSLIVAFMIGAGAMLWSIMRMGGLDK